METLSAIIQKMEYSIDDDFEKVMMECMEDIKENYDRSDSVKPLLLLMERHPLSDFGSPGPIVHFMERFYKKGYEEELVASLNRIPTLHTVWMLQRIINATDDREIYLDLLKQISDNESYDKEIRDEASHFVDLSLR